MPVPETKGQSVNADQELFRYLNKHDSGSLTDIMEVLCRQGSLTDAARSLMVLSAAGFLSFDCRVTIRLTPMGRVLAESLEKNPV